MLVTVWVLILSGCSVFGLRTTEEASYIIVDQQEEFELRQYAGLVIVETTVKKGFKEAGKEAFGKLFGYISGENKSRQEIAMTAPVLVNQASADTGKSIDMTSQVIVDEINDGWRYAFVLPNSFTMANAPIPVNPKIRLVQVQPKLVAVLSYSGLLNEDNFRDNSVRLSNWISKNQLESLSLPRVAGYDPPWTIPFLRRNEIMIDVGS
jgi:hypothetical protein